MIAETAIAVVLAALMWALASLLYGRMPMWYLGLLVGSLALAVNA